MHMRIGKLIIGALIVSVIASGNITNPNIATATEHTDSTTEITTTVTPILEATKESTHPTSFTDMKKGDTYYTAVNYLAKKGAVGGYNDGTFKPSTKITYAKFIGILMRTIDPTLPRATKGKDYDKKALETAYKAGIIKSNEINENYYTVAITRQDMVLYLSRALDYLEEDIHPIKDIENLIPDFDIDVYTFDWEDAVKELYSAGIFTGTAKTYEFKPRAMVSRGTAVNAILKVVESKYRKDMSKVNIPATAEDKKPKELRWNDKDRGLARIGDTWVDKDGKKTILTGIMWNGTTVPGYEQGIDLYSGLKAGGITLKVGANGGIYHRDTTYMGQKLQSATSHKGVKFTYFRDQWLAIAQYESKITDKVKNPKDGQYAEGTHFMKYYAGEGWAWVGPVW